MNSAGPLNFSGCHATACFRCGVGVGGARQREKRPASSDSLFSRCYSCGAGAPSVLSLGHFCPPLLTQGRAESAAIRYDHGGVSAIWRQHRGAPQRATAAPGSAALPLPCPAAFPTCGGGLGDRVRLEPHSHSAVGEARPSSRLRPPGRNACFTTRPSPTPVPKSLRVASKVPLFGREKGSDCGEHLTAH